MQSYTRLVLLVVCFSTMTSLAMQSGKYVMITNSSTNAQVCSTDTPSQVLPMSYGEEVQCGIQCMMSSCPYYQLKSSVPIQCELYNQFPWNFKKTVNCIGYSLNNNIQEKGLSTDCSFPFTYNGGLYTGCAANGANYACYGVNRTTTYLCITNTVASVINTNVSIGNQSVPVQSIASWIIWMRRVGTAYNWSLPWASYQNSFGSVGGSNYWLGLENLYQLTSQSKYRLRMEMKVQSSPNYWISAEFWSFSVGNNTTKYQLHVDGYSGDASNALQYVTPTSCTRNNCADEMKFTTLDADNDLHISLNCATDFGGGWWFHSCFRQCMTCKGGYFYWTDTSGTCDTKYSLAEVRMMMKLQ